ncbi:MAG TPA: hypothetical protein DCK93_21795 [Blastocatellia bacterium]|nr:hypothetical protein [Blastocatellia bacterium]
MESGFGVRRLTPLAYLLDTRSLASQLTCSSSFDDIIPDRFREEYYLIATGAANEIHQRSSLSIEVKKR